MSENFNSHIACEGTDNDINWVCKVCKDLPNYAGMYLYQREREKNQLKNVKDRRADLILLKYYYAFSQFKVVYEYVKAGRSLADSDGARVVVSSDRVEYKDLSVYGKAFQERVNRSGQEAAV